MIEDTCGLMEEIDHQLRQSGLSFFAKSVATKEALVHELVCHCPDVILSNGGLPSFDGFTALGVARETRPDIPFIFVTDSLNEEPGSQPVETRAPVDVLKSPLSKLAPTVRRALREADQRNKLREMELRVLTARWMKPAKIARPGR